MKNSMETVFNGSANGWFTNKISHFIDVVFKKKKWSQ